MARRMLTVIASAVWLIAARPLAAQDVKYNKYQLPNGPTVILHEDQTGFRVKPGMIMI